LIDTAVPIKDHLGKVQSVVNTFREVKSMHRIAHNIAGNQARYTFDSLVGDAPLFQQSLAIAKRAAKGDATLLLSGESGTGKEVFVQAIHNKSARAKGPFVAINCAALPRELIESELFGYAPGSFTGAIKSGRPGKFELASGGTIFLDEISELPFDVQAKLLRVLQERQVVRVGESRSIDIDVRVISASNKDLREMVQAKRFREDLYYRINVIEIDIPSLRRRREDIPLLANTFLRKYASSLRKDVFRIEEVAMQQLTEFDWPGNVRQLENIIERTVHLSEDKSLKFFDLDRIRNNEPILPVGPKGNVQTLASVEKDALLAALAAFHYNITHTANALGIARPTLYAKIRKHGLSLERVISDSSSQNFDQNNIDV
jgi:transcriptional regulator with PAS, ATPase and Fis domain